MSVETQPAAVEAGTTLFHPTFNADPFPIFAQLRAQAPIQRVQQPDGQEFWLVLRYEDVLAVLKDRRFTTNHFRFMEPERLARIPPALRRENSIITAEGADHTRLRGLLTKAFTPRFMEGLRPRIQQLTDELLDAVQARGQMDLIDEFAFPLPITVILEMLGLPVEDRERCRAGSNALLAGTDRTGAAASPERLALIEAFMEYVSEQIAHKRAHPSADLLSELIAAEEAGDRLSEPELLSLVRGLIVAGHETTVNLIGMGVLELLRHPEQMAYLRAHPEQLPAAVEELLRFTSVAAATITRYATQDIEVGGTLIRTGEAVMAAIGAANHDAAQFANPDELDFARAGGRHMTFGHGMHYCIGAPLARLEGQVAIGTMLRRLPELRLSPAPDALIWRQGWGLRGLLHLQVEF